MECDFGAKPVHNMNTKEKQDFTELFSNIDKIHTTPLGALRIKKNLDLETDDVVTWCVENIKSAKSIITRNGKN
jgi:hypothetical protein